MKNMRIQDEDYKKFKCLLEYFVAHLETYNRIRNNDNYKVDDSKFGSSQHKKIKVPFNKLPDDIFDRGKIRIEEACKDSEVVWAGQTYRSGSIGRQIELWNTYTMAMRIGISVDVRNFRFDSKSNYLHWLGTGINIKLVSNDKGNNIVGIEIINVDSKSHWEDYDFYTLTQLGLFDDNEPNDMCKHMFDKYYKVGLSAVEKQSHYVKILRDNYNLILTGAPGTGKTYLARQIAKNIIGIENYDNFIEQVQFHPSYDYTDFVEGLRPIARNGQISFNWHMGHFMNFCNKAANDTNNNYVFIIDEINRGEVNKIFGELFFSIDPGYRLPKDRQFIKTQYHDSCTEFVDEKGYPSQNGIVNKFYKQGFYVPENVYIIGTMNDIDRSVESFDFAFRRRFAWEEVVWQDRIGFILDNTFKDSNVDLNIQKTILSYFENLNAEISEVVGTEFCLGGSYINKLNAEEVNKDFHAAMTELWDRFLNNIINDYVRGLDDSKLLYERLKRSYKASK